MMERTDFLTSVALGRDDRDKLAQLATATGRSRSAVVRLLIRSAALTGQLDVRLEDAGNARVCQEAERGGQT